MFAIIVLIPSIRPWKVPHHATNLMDGHCTVFEMCPESLFMYWQLASAPTQSVRFISVSHGQDLISDR